MNSDILKKKSFKAKETHTFKEDFNKIASFFYDFRKFDIFGKDIVTLIEMKVGDNTYTPGNECILIAHGVAKMSVKCLEFVLTSSYMKISNEVKDDSFGLYVIVTHHLYNDSINKTSVFCWEGEFFDCDKPIVKEFINQISTVVEDFCKSFEEFLKNNKENTVQYESAIINTDMSKLWNLIINWEELIKVAPQIGDEVVYTGNGKLIGDIFIVKSKKKNFNYTLQVKKVGFIEKSDHYKYVLSCINSSHKIPSQEIRFVVKKLSDNSSFLIFKHIFMEKVKEEMINALSSEKLTILKSIKQYYDK